MELENLVNQYKTPSDAIDVVRTTKIVLLVGISGAGKDTIKSRLLLDSDYMDIVSHTTRQIRTNNSVEEIDGVDYNFITPDTATKMVVSKDFIEVKYVHGTIYGTSTQAVRNAHNNSKIAITDLDVQGVDEYKTLSSDVTALFILPPDFQTWKSRLAKRYKQDEAFNAEWPKRRASAIKELTHALSVPYYHFIINDDLDRAVKAVDAIAHRGDHFNDHDAQARRVADKLLAAISGD